MDTFRHRRFVRDPALVAERVIDETSSSRWGAGRGAFAGPYVLNEVGGHIWSLLDGVRTGEEIARRSWRSSRSASRRLGAMSLPFSTSLSGWALSGRCEMTPSPLVRPPDGTP